MAIMYRYFLTLHINIFYIEIWIYDIDLCVYIYVLFDLFIVRHVSVECGWKRDEMLIVIVIIHFDLRKIIVDILVYN